MLHSRKTSPSEDWFSRVCIHLAFFLALALIWQGGVAIAGKIISYGQEQQVEAINKLVHRLQTGPVDLAESQQIQNTVKEFISAYISAILSFEFFPRNDMELLTKIISATPEEASIEEISFQGRDITIQALCPSLGQVEEMARNLQAGGFFSNVVHTFYVDSQGESPVLPDLAGSRERLDRMRQKLSRMERGSRNYERQMERIRLQYEHIANQRRDFVHKESRRIANAWDAVCVRDTDLAELSRRLRHAHVMDSGFGMFRECLKYKLERQGKAYIVVDRFAPAAKTCHFCGHVNEELTTRRRTWTCPSCGAAVCREVNTARNLRDFGIREAGAA